MRAQLQWSTQWCHRRSELTLLLRPHPKYFARTSVSSLERLTPYQTSRPCWLFVSIIGPPLRWSTQWYHRGFQTHVSVNSCFFNKSSPILRSRRHLRALHTIARPAQPLEPILFPKLRIQFADFPYLHCSIGQRLFTLETCCGYGYDLARK